MKRKSVCVSIVTCNSRRFIRTCLESLMAQRYEPMEVVVVDNGSRDGTLEELEPFRRGLRLIRNEGNLGFAAAQNQAITASRSDWVLALNPDTVLLPGFVQKLVEAGRIDGKVGTVCGKLRSI